PRFAHHSSFLTAMSTYLAIARPMPSWRASRREAQDGEVIAGTHLLVPIKPLRRAKSRLRGATDPEAHADLVAAVALDTVTAARQVAEVVVVTSDPMLTAAL